MNQTEAKRSMPKNCPQCGAALPSGALTGLCPACLLQQGAAPDTGPADKAPFVPPSVEEVARFFPQLEILSLIGRGGMGAVYKARQSDLDRLVALKILPSRDPGFAERFNREARALARLSHPNIVAVHEFGQVNGQHYFLMEFVDGVNLRQMEQAGRLSPREALQIIPQLCDALQYAHDEGVVHRDIKPDNVLVDRKGRVKIADFGIAKIMGQAAVGVSDTGAQALGTPHYMAPEQLEKPQTVDHRADIYSLGVVFYEMLTGELPLGKFAPPSHKVEMDVRIDEVVLRALEKEPEQRFQRASEIKTRVETIAQQPSWSATMAPANPPRRGMPAWAVAVLTTCLVIAALAAASLITYQLGRQPDKSKPTARVSPEKTPPPSIQRMTVSWGEIRRQPARVEVAKMEAQPLIESQDKNGWLRVPEQLRRYRTQVFSTPEKHLGVTDYRVTRSGWLLVACYYGYDGNASGGWTSEVWKREDFYAHGWREATVEDLGGRLVKGDNREQVVFVKRVTAGETGRLRCNKYAPPLFILCSDGPVR